MPTEEELLPPPPKKSADFIDQAEELLPPPPKKKSTGDITGIPAETSLPGFGHKTLDEAIAALPVKKASLSDTETPIEKADATQTRTVSYDIIPKGNRLKQVRTTADFNEKYGTDHTVQEMVTGTQSWRHPKDHAKAPEEETDAKMVKESIQSAAAGLDATYAMMLRMPNMLYNTFVLPINAALRAAGKPGDIKADDTGILERSAQYYADQGAQVLSEQQQKYDKSIFDEFNEGDKGKAVQQLSNSIIQMLPPMMAMAGAGVAGASPAATELGAVLAFGSDKYKELESLNLPETTKMSNALGTGMLMSMFNKWSLDKISIPVAKALTQKGEEAAAQVAKETFEETYQQVFKKLAPVTDPLHSAIAFAATGFATNVLDKVTGIDPEKDLSEGLVDMFIEGLGLGAITHAGTRILNRDRRDKTGQLHNEVEQVKSDLDNPEVSPDIKESLLQTYQDKTSLLNEELQTERENQIKYTDQERSIVDDLSEKIEQNKKVLADPAVSTETKNLITAENEKISFEIDKINKAVESRKVKMYQGSDFIAETGLQPGLYTDDQVKNAKKIQKSEQPAPAEPIPAGKEKKDPDIHNQDPAQSSKDQSAEIPETGTVLEGGLKDVLIKASKIEIDKKGKITEIRQNSGAPSQLFKDLTEITGSKDKAADIYLRLKDDAGDFKRNFADWENKIMADYGRAGHVYSIEKATPKEKEQHANDFAWSDEKNGKPVIMFNDRLLTRDIPFKDQKEGFLKEVIDPEIEEYKAQGNTAAVTKMQEYKALFEKYINSNRDIKMHLIHNEMYGIMNRGKEIAIDDIQNNYIRSVKEMARLNDVELAKDYYGEPMIYMHAGNEGIKRFNKPGSPGYKKSDELTGEGIYFSRDIPNAEKYSAFNQGMPAQGKDIYYTFLKYKNPFYMDDPQAQSKVKVSDIKTLTAEKIKELEAAGYDAVIKSSVERPKEEVVVFNPDQIEIIGSYKSGLKEIEKIIPPKKDISKELEELKKDLRAAKTQVRKREIEAKINMVSRIEKLQNRENRRNQIKKSIKFEPVDETDFLETASYGISEKSIVNNKLFKAKEEKGAPVLNSKGQPVYPDMPRSAYMTGRVLKEGGREASDIAEDLIREGGIFEHADPKDLEQKIIEHALRYPAGVKQYLRSKRLLDEALERAYDENAKYAEEQMPEDFTDDQALEYDDFVSKIQDITEEEYEKMLLEFSNEAALEDEFFNNITDYENSTEKSAESAAASDQTSRSKDIQKGPFTEELDQRIEARRKDLKAAQQLLADKTIEFSDRAVGDLFGKSKSEGDLFDTGDVSEDTARIALRPYEEAVKSAQRELELTDNPEQRKRATELDRSQVKINHSRKSPTGDASMGVKPTIDDMVNSKTTSSEPFSYHERIKKILEKIGVPVAEKNLPKKFLGLFKHRSKNIRVQSLFDIFTATHETAHYISREYDLGSKLSEKAAISKTNPEKDLNRSLRKDLTDIYVEFYPGSSKKHRLELRVEEGIAVLMERYLFDPADISTRYKSLVDTFINPAGKYYHPKFTELLTEMNTFVKDYSSLTPEEKIGSRVARGEEVLKTDTGFNTKQKAIFEAVYVGEPLRRMDEIAGAGLTKESAEIAHFRWMDRKTIISNWIQGNDHAMTVDRSGNWKPIKASVNEYLGMISGKEKEFDSYLVARRVEGDVNHLNQLINDYSEIMATIDPEVPLSREEVQEIQDLKDKIERQQEIIKADQFDIQTASDVVKTYDAAFKKAVAVFDKLNNAIVDFAESTGLLTPGKAELYKNNKTYASFQRLVYDDLMADVSTGTNSQATVSAFLGRKGSNLQIKSPVASQIMLINETISKGMQNQIWQRLAELGNKEVEIARRFEKIETITSVDPKGKITYPQDNDPNLIKVLTKGKREYYKAAPEILAFAETMTPQQLETFTYLLRYASGVFSRLTTTANPLFPLVNIPVDTISAWMNTKTGFRPVWDQVKTLKDMAEYSHNYILHLDKVSKWFEAIKGVKIKNLQQQDLSLFEKYLALGGKKQTMSSYHDMTPEELIAQTKGGTMVRKVVKAFDDYTLSLLEIPSNMSEYMTRFAEFKRAKELGYVDDVAMYLASQVSVPFQQTGRLGGRFGTAFVKSIPYFNATMQVAAKFLKTASEDPKKVGMVAASLFSTAIGMSIASMEFADDKDKRVLAEQTPQELSKYMYIPNKIFGGDGFTRIRIPEQIGAITGLAYLAVIEGYGKTKYKMKDYLDAATVSIPNQFNITKPEQMPWAMTPQIIKPALEVTANIRSYPDIGPLVPIGLENKMPEYQYTEYTSESAKLAGKLLGLSPVKIEYFTRQQFGQVPQMLLNWGESAILDKKSHSNNRLIKQEKDFILRGRSYNDFYKYYDFWHKQNQSILDMYQESHRTPKELAEIHANYQNFSHMKKILAAFRDVVKEHELDEETKNLLFETLQQLNYSDKPYEAKPNINKLQQKLRKK